MTALEGKRVLLGVTGSIAAYKAAFLVRLLVKAKAEVQVILTDSGGQFITPLTLGTLSKRPVHTVLADLRTGEWVNHVALGEWADAFAIAPASANTLAKMAHGQSDNLLLTTYLSATCPVLVCPAMDRDMYQHPAVQSNLKALSGFPRHTVLEAREGELASGLEGQGRMAEPEEILKALASLV